VPWKSDRTSAAKFSSTALPTPENMTIKHAKAVYKGVVIAESDSCQLVEGNLYFPPSSIDIDHFTPSSLSTTCGWKGTASKSIVPRFKFIFRC